MKVVKIDAEMQHDDALTDEGATDLLEAMDARLPGLNVALSDKTGATWVSVTE